MKNVGCLTLCAVLVSCALGCGGGGGGGGSPPVTCLDSQVGMGMSLLHSGNFWEFSGTASDPDPCFNRAPSVLTKVTNTSGFEMSLYHSGSNGVLYSVFLPKGASSTGLNGLPVAGDWFATISVSRENAPLSIGFQIDWSK